MIYIAIIGLLLFTVNTVCCILNTCFQAQQLKLVEEMNEANKQLALAQEQYRRWQERIISERQQND